VTIRNAIPTGTVTMLFTDIEGSTRLLKQLGERYGDLLADHRRLLRAAFAAHGGREMDTQGDAFFVAFARARNAVEAAVDAQRALAGHEWPEGVKCRVRMGLHTGEPSVAEEGYHGIGLHRGHEDQLHVQIGLLGWFSVFATPGGFIVGALNCGSYNTENTQSSNFAEFCDPKIDREIARARSLQTNDPEAASLEWAKIDRNLTWQAPWVPYANAEVIEVRSSRVGNYQYNPQWGTLLDQLWVH